MKKQNLEMKFIRLERAVNKHIITEEDNIEKLRQTFHSISTELFTLKNPIITVMNGTEKEMFQKDVLAEVWQATASQRFMLKVSDYLKLHKPLKYFIFFIIIMAISGLIFTPFIYVFQLVKLILHI